MRPARVAFVMLVPLVSTLVLAPPAAADALPSSACGGGTVVEAYTGPGGDFARGFSYFQEYVRVDVVQSSTSTTICYVLDVHEYGVIQHRGGWIRLDGVTASAAPSVDGDSDYCRRNVGTGSPAVAGSLGDPSDPPSLAYYLRALIDGTGAHLCVELGTDVRAHVHLGVPAIVGVPGVAHEEDPQYDPASNGPQPPSPVPPPGGSESGVCQSTDTSSWRIVRVLGFSAFHSNEYGSSPAVACYRINTPADGFGWALYQGWQGGPHGGVTTKSFVDESCTVVVAHGESPLNYTVWRSPTGTLPAHVCVVSPANPQGLSVTYEPVGYSPPDPTGIRFDA